MLSDAVLVKRHPCTNIYDNPPTNACQSLACGQFQNLKPNQTMTNNTNPSARTKHTWTGDFTFLSACSSSNAAGCPPIALSLQPSWTCLGDLWPPPRDFFSAEVAPELSSTKFTIFCCLSSCGTHFTLWVVEVLWSLPAFRMDLGVVFTRVYRSAGLLIRTVLSSLFTPGLLSDNCRQ